MDRDHARIVSLIVDDLSKDSASHCNQHSFLSQSPTSVMDGLPLWYHLEDWQCLDSDIIRSICAYIVSRIEEAERDQYVPPREYSIFCSYSKSIPDSKDSFRLETIQQLFNIIYQEGEMEYECMIIALLYLERLSTQTNHTFRLCALNWRYTLFTCMILASKIWDDFTLKNGAFADIFYNTSLHHLNRLERHLLKILDYRLGVSIDEYMALHSLLCGFVHTARELRVRNSFEEKSDILHIFPGDVILHQRHSDMYMIATAASGSCSLPHTLNIAQCKKKRKRSVRRSLGKIISAVSRRLLPQFRKQPSNTFPDCGKVQAEPRSPSSAVFFAAS